MEKNNKRKTKMSILTFLSGIAVMIAANNYSIKFEKNKTEELTKNFPVPNFEESFQTTKEVEQYSYENIDGSITTIQGDSIRIYSFDEEGNVDSIAKGEKIEVPIDNYGFVLESYASERERLVYNVIENKDLIETQFQVFLLFEEMQKLYEEYLSREYFDSLEIRKETLYKIAYDYISSDEGYTLGKYKFQDLGASIQNDIIENYKNILYMKKNSKLKHESKLDEFIDLQIKVLKYEVFRKGR